MRVYVICVVLGIWAFDLILRSNHKGLVDAQNWNVSKKFKKFEFEWTHRGAFNMSYCAREFINCYEIFQLQVVCGYWVKRDSICSAMTRHCHDAYGDDQDYERGKFDLGDEFCYYWWNDYWWSRRSMSEDQFALNSTTPDEATNASSSP